MRKVRRTVQNPVLFPVRRSGTHFQKVQRVRTNKFNNNNDTTIGKTDSMKEKSDQDPKTFQVPAVKQDWHEFVTFGKKDQRRNWHFKCNFCGKAMSGSRKRWSEHIVTDRNKRKNV